MKILQINDSIRYMMRFNGTFELGYLKYDVIYEHADVVFNDRLLI